MTVVPAKSLGGPWNPLTQGGLTWGDSAPSRGHLRGAPGMGQVEAGTLLSTYSAQDSPTPVHPAPVSKGHRADPALWPGQAREAI